MEGMLFSIYWLSTRAWLVSLIIVVFLPICVFSNEQLDSQATSRLLTQFDELERSFQHSEDPFFEAYQFLKSLVEKINLEHGTSLNLVEAGKLIEIHIDEFQLPNEIKESLVRFIEFLGVVDRSFLTGYSSSVCFIDLRLWNWVNWYKKHALVDVAVSQDPPDGVIFGLVEIFAGALLCVIPTSLTWTIGGGLILDGLTRAVGATFEEAANNRESQEQETSTKNSKSIDQISSVRCKVNAWRRQMLLSVL